MLEQAERKARETSLERLSQMMETEREAIEKAKQALQETPEGKALAELQEKLEAHLEGREILEMNLQEAKETVGMLARVSAKTGVPLKTLLFILTVALESGAYASAAGIHLGRRRRLQSKEAAQRKTALGTVAVENVSVNIGEEEATMTRTYQGGSQSQSMTVQREKLSELEAIANQAAQWAEQN